MNEQPPSKKQRFISLDKDIGACLKHNPYDHCKLEGLFRSKAVLLCLCRELVNYGGVDINQLNQLFEAKENIDSPITATACLVGSVHVVLS